MADPSHDDDFKISSQTDASAGRDASSSDNSSDGLPRPRQMLTPTQALVQLADLGMRTDGWLHELIHSCAKKVLKHMSKEHKGKGSRKRRREDTHAEADSQAAQKPKHRSRNSAQEPQQRDVAVEQLQPEQSVEVQAVVVQHSHQDVAVQDAEVKHKKKHKKEKKSGEQKADKSDKASDDSKQKRKRRGKHSRAVWSAEAVAVINQELQQAASEQRTPNYKSLRRKHLKDFTLDQIRWKAQRLRQALRGAGSIPDAPEPEHGADSDGSGSSDADIPQEQIVLSDDEGRPSGLFRPQQSLQALQAARLKQQQQPQRQLQQQQQPQRQLQPGASKQRKAIRPIPAGEQMTPLRQRIQEVLAQAPGHKGTVLDVCEELLCEDAYAGVQQQQLQKQVANVLSSAPEFISTRAYQSASNKRVEYELDTKHAAIVSFRGRKSRP